MTKYIIKSSVKEKTKGMAISTTYMLELDKQVEKLIESSMQRAKSNDRNTLMDRDV